MENESVKQSVQQNIKDAMRRKDAALLLVLRSMLAKITEAEKDNAQLGELSADATNRVLVKMYKQRLESAQMYREHQQTAAAEVEESQAAYIKTFLLEDFDEAKIREIISALIAEGATNIGAVMGKLKPYGTKIDGKLASTLAKELLA